MAGEGAKVNLGQGKSTFNVENLVPVPPITPQHLNEEHTTAAAVCRTDGRGWRRLAAKRLVHLCEGALHQLLELYM